MGEAVDHVPSDRVAAYTSRVRSLAEWDASPSKKGLPAYDPAADPALESRRERILEAQAQQREAAAMETVDRILEQSAHSGQVRRAIAQLPEAPVDLLASTSPADLVRSVVAERRREEEDARREARDARQQRARRLLFEGDAAAPAPRARRGPFDATVSPARRRPEAVKETVRAAVEAREEALSSCSLALRSGLTASLAKIMGTVAALRSATAAVIRATGGKPFLWDGVDYWMRIRSQLNASVGDALRSLRSNLQRTLEKQHIRLSLHNPLLLPRTKGKDCADEALLIAFEAHGVLEAHYRAEKGDVGASPRRRAKAKPEFGRRAEARAVRERQEAERRAREEAEAKRVREEDERERREEDERKKREEEEEERRKREEDEARRVAADRAAASAPRGIDDDALAAAIAASEAYPRVSTLPAPFVGDGPVDSLSKPFARRVMQPLPSSPVTPAVAAMRSLSPVLVPDDISDIDDDDDGELAFDDEDEVAGDSLSLSSTATHGAHTHDTTDGSFNVTQSDLSGITVRTASPHAPSPPQPSRSAFVIDVDALSDFDDDEVEYV